MLANRALTARADEAADHLADLCRHLRTGVLSRMADYADGVPAGALARSAGHGSHADPTAARALDRRHDLATLHRAEIERDILRALAMIRRALDIAELYPEAHPARAAERAALERLNARAEPGCQNCARVTGPAGVPRWEPVDSRLSNPTVAGGVLPEPMWLCRWCNEHTRLWSRLPNTVELERHHRGERVRWPDDVARPA